MVLLDGKKVAFEIESRVKAETDSLKLNGRRLPRLVAVLVGEDGASETYVGNKMKVCERVGFLSSLVRLPQTVSRQELLHTVRSLNDDPETDGIIVQLPLPKHIDAHQIAEAIDPMKDVDGFHPINVGKMVKNLSCHISATPYGILRILEHYRIETKGKHCVVVGRSDIVGSPLSILLSRNNYPGNCTVTLCHSQTQDLEFHTRHADILVASVGIPEFIRGNMVKEGVVVIDVGITRVPDAASPKGYVIKGDVYFESVSPKASYITPVPGGVGAVTVASLIENTLRAYKREVFTKSSNALA